MPNKNEAPQSSGASRKSCGGCFRKSVTCHDDLGQALVAYIHQFVPDAQGKELELRLALVKARDYCARLRGTTVNFRAHNHACDGHEMAGEYVFADVPTGRLEIAVSYCRHIVMAAFLADHLESEGAA